MSSPAKIPVVILPCLLYSASAFFKAPFKPLICCLVRFSPFFKAFIPEDFKAEALSKPPAIFLAAFVPAPLFKLLNSALFDLIPSRLDPIPEANFPILLLSIFAESSSNAGSTDFKSVEAKIASTATADFIFSVKNPASTSAIGVINSIALSFKSIKVAINLLNWLTGTASPTAPYFSSD